MTQNRKPPAYQEYASELLANKNFRLMGLAERGLLYTLKLECWANMLTPSKKEELAKYLGITLRELSDAFTTRVETFIEISGDDLRMPEIDDYRKHLVDRREKQSKGGKVGAKITNKKLSKNSASITNHTIEETHVTRTANLSSNPRLTRQGGNESLVEFNKAKPRKAESVNNHIAWIDDYDKASNGD